MHAYDIVIHHSCGHAQRHTGESSDPDLTWIRGHYAKKKCARCRPTCAYCHRTGNREDMVIENEIAFCNPWCKGQSLKPTHYAEHNEIAIPEFLRHWEDRSWHNDACARSSYGVGKGAVIVWVECDAPEERETGDKYAVEYWPDADDVTGDESLLYAGDDATEAQAWAEAAEIAACGPDDDDTPMATERAAILAKLIKGEK